MKVLGVLLDTILLLESHLRLKATSTSSTYKLGIKGSLYLFSDPVLVLMCLELPASCVRVQLPCLDACYAASHLYLSDRVLSKAIRLRNDLVVCHLEHTHSVTALCMF